MNDEAPFLDALRADPTDATLLLVYADWLDERRDWLRPPPPDRQFPPLAD